MKKRNIISGEIYSFVKQVTPTIALARLRTFYKGFNINQGYFSDEFSEKLLSSAPYTPVKGEYNEITEDFEGHNADGDRSRERIYGVVPADFNLAWEPHLDDDGVEREYACIDVFIYTSIYDEASKIVGKKQSMELYPPSIKGKFVEINGEPVYLYEDAIFLGLQVLGDDKDPCYQGSAFFTLIEAIKNFEEEIKLSSEEAGGKENMIKFPDNADYTGVFQALNPSFSFENGGEVKFIPTGIHERYTYYVDLETGCAYYSEYTTVDGKIQMGEQKQASAVNFSLEDYGKAKEIYGENLDFFAYAENAIEVAQKVTTLETTLTEMTSASEEKDTKITSLEEAAASFEEKVTSLEEVVSSFEEERRTLTEELTSLREFQKAKDDEEKKIILSKFEDRLPADTIADYSKKLDSFTLEDLKKELSYEAINLTGLFSLNEGRIPSHSFSDEDEGGLSELLSKYAKKSEIGG